jgi:hypothetical protein
VFSVIIFNPLNHHSKPNSTYLLMRNFYLSLLFITCTSFCFAQNNALEKEFIKPPSSVQTSIYWYWMSGNISKAGVVKDLEAMKKVGINRAFIGNIYFDPYPGGRNVKLMSDEWWDITHAALKKASELGIEIGMFNSPGWTQAGGPWIKPNEAMRYLASTELKVKGPLNLNTTLKKPNEQFEDVKVIAYPAPKEERLILDRTNAKISISPALKNADNLFDGNQLTEVALPENQNITINLNTTNNFTARSLSIYPSHTNINASFELQVKKGSQFQTISKFNIDWHHLALIVGFQPFAPVVISINETTAKEFRLLVVNKRNEGGIVEIELSASPKIENYAAKTFAKMFQDPLPQWDYYMWRKQPEAKDLSRNIDPAKVLDISKYLTADGKLNWKVPKGEWIILRTGMTPTGVTNNPGGPDGTGLEVDKMSKQHVATHFDAFIGKILKRIPANDRKTFKVVVQDSYESGGQNFTDALLSSFKKTYGYDPIPYLPAYFGKVVGSQRQSDRFLWDLRRLIADKIAYDYVGGFREICHRYGLSTWLENYGHWGFPAEFLMYGGQSDEVGGEYWLPSNSPSWENNLGNIENRAASSCAHIYGKNLVSAESNTSGGPAFSHVPADTKQRTDKYFAEGINNTLLHVYVHQPDSTRFPGTNAWFGTEFNRNNTWFSHMDLFIDYVKRCNYMLRQGLNIADVAYFIGEDVPKMTGVQDPVLPKSYQFDYINAEVILRDAQVKNGLITLPHGTSYRVLVIPKINTMRPELLSKIKQLIADGAIVLGPPPVGSPSLKNQPNSDQLVKKMAAALWKGADGTQATSAKFGKGRIFNGVSLEEVFAKIGTIADCKIASGMPINFNHRKLNNGDIYFITNQSATVQSTHIGFRIKDMQPELWNPIDGSMRKLPEFSAQGDVTDVPIELQAYESMFIVFRTSGKALLGKQNFPKPTSISEQNNLWKLNFEGKLSNPKPIQLNKLQDLSKSNDPLIKYFSGNIVYNSTFEVNLSEAKNNDVYLDLGEVNNMAKIWINDQYVGGLWTPPYRVKVSAALKQGLNKVRIDVVNTWVNRMIGDKIVPEKERETWSGINPYNPDSPLQKTGLLGPIKLIYTPANN